MLKGPFQAPAAHPSGVPEKSHKWWVAAYSPHLFSLY